MAYTNGYIHGNVDLRDVQRALRSSLISINSLAQNASGTINKWAKYKPVRIAHPQEVTEDELQSTNYGLSIPQAPKDALAALRSMVDLTQAQYDAIVGNTQQWVYAPPQSTDYKRFTDFNNASDKDLHGYNRNAKPPIGQFKDAVVRSVDFLGDGQRVLYTGYSARYGTESYQQIGDSTGNIEIPVNYLAPSGDKLTNGGWRLALVIFFPKNSQNKYPFQIAAQDGELHMSNTSFSNNDFIDLCGTSQLRYLYEQTLGNQAQTTLTALPVLMKGLSKAQDTQQTRGYWTCAGVTQFIPMPEGNANSLISITVKSSANSLKWRWTTFGLRYLPQNQAVVSNVTPSASKISLSRPADNTKGVSVTLGFAVDEVALEQVIGWQVVGLAFSGTELAAGSNISLTKGGAAQANNQLSTTGNYVLTITEPSGQSDLASDLAHRLLTYPSYTGVEDTPLTFAIRFAVRNASNGIAEYVTVLCENFTATKWHVSN